MALALRIDSITPLDQGGVILGYTLGPTPLPAAASGLGLETSTAKLNAKLAEFTPLDAMVMLAFALWKANNPALNNPAQIIGKVLTINAGTTSPVTIA